MKLFILIILLNYSSQSHGMWNSDKGKEGHMISLGLDIETVASFSEGTTSLDDSFSMENNLKFEQSYSLGYEFRKVEPQSFGYSFGLTWFAKRSLEEKNTDISSDGGSSSKKSTYSKKNAPNIKVISASANGHMMWENFYITLGISIFKLDYNKERNDILTWKSSGLTGINYGLGYALTEEYFIDIIIQNLNWKLKASDGVDSYNYEDGTLKITSLNFKYMFF